MKFNFYSDASHGWLEAPINMLRDFGIDSAISSYSYIKGGFVYLEEDCDAPKLIKALKEKGEAIEFTEIYHKNSPIRNFDYYRGA